MIGMVRAELLKIRRRWASYIVLGVLIGLMALIFLLAAALGGRGRGGDDLVARFPLAYGVINQFVFGLGSLLAVAYAAAVAGADWSWGIMRVVVARGEGRGRYIVAKAVGFGIALFVGVLIAYLAGILLTYISAAIADTSAGDPVAGSGLSTLFRSIGYGFLVLAQRAAIGFAVAIVLRSQLAGVVIGIVLYIGEQILSGILIFASVRQLQSTGGGLDTLGTQWYQFLPFSIGDSVISAGASIPSANANSLLQPVPLPSALAATAIYLVIAIGIAALVTRRAEIRS
ncbi:MAG: type transport system permease protein [Chloroflexota bacterium]|nr:type transport system permease protein [Chloroflexota bacterium]